MDIAKALAIISVPISHTIALESIARVAIFSLHMPLFFILSGFTTTPAKDWRTLFKRAKKNFLCLMLPSFIVICIHAIMTGINTGADFGGFVHLLLSKNYIFFINPFPYDLTICAAVWFMVALFFAKLIVDLVNVSIKSDKNGIVLLLLGMLGVYLGIADYRLSFYLDLSFVACLFIEIGLLWRKYEKVIKKYTPILLLISFFFWFSCVLRRNFLELWMRFYGGYELSIIEAIAGSFIVANIAMMMEEAAKKSKRMAKKIVTFFVEFGSNTMLFYMIHCLDDTFFEKLWDFRRGIETKWMILSVVLRLIVDFSVYFIIKGAIGYYKKSKKPTSVKSRKILKK